jgi:hypothetical protein
MNNLEDTVGWAKAHEVIDVLSFAFEPRRAIGHHTFALRGANLSAEIGFAAFAELALAALGSVKRNNVVSLTWKGR